MGAGLSISIERRVERMRKRSGTRRKKGGDGALPDPDPDPSASLPRANDSDGGGDIRIMENATDVRLDNCNLTAVNGTLVKATVTTYNMNLGVQTDAHPKIVAWVSAINYQDIQDDNLSKQIGETSMWVLEEPFFVDWEASDQGMLWGTGIPGAGKTVLASIVINHLRKRAKVNKKILVAFAYCRYTDPFPIKIILAAIIRQILEDYPLTVVFVKPLYEKHKLRNTRPTEGELIELLTTIFTSEMFDQRFLFVDGLDEATSETQFDILDTLCKLPLNTLFTSRPLPLLKDSVPEAIFFDIIVRDADIERLISEKVRGMKTLAKLLEQDGWRERVLKAVLKKSSGMFLVASLQLDMLRSCLSIRDLQASLDRLPKGVEAMYTSTMERIEQQADPLLATRALMWLVHALESMTIDDLRYALATDSVTFQHDSDLLVDAESLVSLCCGLITLEPQSKLVRLVHYTAKDFLEPYLRKDYPEPHALIASGCVARMTYCGLQDMQDKPWNGYNNSIFKENPFLAYSHRQWAPHSHLSASTSPDIVDFILQCRHFPIADKHTFLIDHGSSVHVAAAFNFHTLLREWSNETKPVGANPFPHQPNITARTKHGYTALYFSSWLGHLETVRALLSMEGIDVCCPSSHSITPLMLASEHGHLKIVELLLGVVDVDHINATDKGGWSALTYASFNGHVEVVRAILGFQCAREGRTTAPLDQSVCDEGIPYGAGINVNGASTDDETALIVAAQGGETGVVQELLRVKDIDVDHCSSPCVPYDCGGPALAHASACGHSAVVELLLKHPGIGINIVVPRGRTALGWAVKKGHRGIAALLRSRLAQERAEYDSDDSMVQLQSVSNSSDSGGSMPSLPSLSNSSDSDN
ncbi:ankyrin [Coprinopsis marcescibilis]|uniref:Ankyrin n=1 Tax=Coprinopsis marcescibilis TaxID=230819 RepID=A0A5C3L2L4_COPMA|nr:ankyrin [Coprinopsis marcescibilis]